MLQFFNVSILAAPLLINDESPNGEVRELVGVAGATNEKMQLLSRRNAIWLIIPHVPDILFKGKLFGCFNLGSVPE